MRYLPWTLADDEALVRAYKRGDGRKAIARALNRSPDGIGARVRSLRAQGVQLPRMKSGRRSADHVAHLNALLEGTDGDKE